MKRIVVLLLLCLVPLSATAKRRALRSGSSGPGGRDFDRAVVAGGIRHEFHVYVPSSYDGKRTVPLVLFFHGGGGNADQGERSVNLRATAERHGFILVRPEGYDGSGLGLRTWNAGGCCGGAVTAGIDHVEAVRRILDDVARSWRIDERRVYATGHSNGGMMAYRLACELADRITAIAPNSAVLVDENLDVTPPRELFPCVPARPVPVMHMHGDADRCVPFEGGRGTGIETSLRPPVRDSIARFLAINHTVATPRITREQRDVTCRTWDGAGNNDVVLCVARGGGHAWPGARYSARTKSNCGGNAITGMDANEAIWQFFDAHPR